MHSPGNINRLDPVNIPELLSFPLLTCMIGLIFSTVHSLLPPTAGDAVSSEVRRGDMLQAN